VKRRLGDWCEMAASLEVISHLVISWVLDRRLWRQNLSVWIWRFSIVRSCCEGTADDDTAGWKKA
jgi:hypothetical protein